MTSTPVQPTGRGAWTTRGGTKNRWYELLTPEAVGQRFAQKGADAGQDYQVVNRAAAGIQRILTDRGYGVLEDDGWWGRKTDAAFRKFQKDLGLTVDGKMGPSSARTMLRPEVVLVAASHGVPEHLLHGMFRLESGYDPGAVGANGQDTGLAQINLGVHTEWDIPKACDARLAITFGAMNLRAGYERTKNDALRTGVDPWDTAVAYHNSPAMAVRWAKEGKPPEDPKRSISIARYVELVRVEAAKP